MPKQFARDIAASLASRIRSGEWTGALPNERMLAGEYGVARNTLRRAMDMVEKEGLVSRQVGRGTLVREQGRAEFIEIMQKISGTSPLDIMNMRLIIEPQACAAAATNASESQLQAIRQAHSAGCEARSMEAFEQADNAFHHSIFLSTRNEFLTNLHDMLLVIRGRQPMVEIRRRGYSEERRQSYCEQHGAILGAIALRDSAGAAKAMREHLLARSMNLFGTV